jgi:hypothetical protein
MEKLDVLKDGEIVDEIELGDLEVVVGRDAECDIYLNDPSVSRRHSRIFKIYNDYFIEDLGSTNGTMLNDRAVKKHILSSGDRLSIGGFGMRFVDTAFEQGEVEEDDMDKTVILDTRSRPVAPATEVAAERKVAPKTATIRFFRGPNKGHSERILRSLYTIGKPGGDVAVIARRPQGFYLLHIGGATHPRINNQEIATSAGVQLNEGDVFEVGDNLAEISFG